jgi:peptide/nickel transport system substrate-binding protein
MTRTVRGAVITTTAIATALALSACGTSTGGDPSAEPTNFVSGGTFTMAINEDPGNLSPLTGVNLAQRALVPFGYESLAYITPEGETVPWMAESWEESGTSITYTLKDGLTCADGTEFTAETAANNIAYQSSPDNGTFWFGSNITEDMTASAEGNVLTIESATNNPFLLQSTGAVEMVCQAGLDDPESLADSTNGTALYELSDVEAGSAYTYSKRDGYTWGPEDVTSETEGLPDEIVARVVADEATSANLLISGELNAASVLGADRERIEAAGLDSVGVLNPIGQMLFNEREDRPTADVRVRQARAHAHDQESIGELVTDGSYQPSVSLVNKIPLTCVSDGPLWELPERDVDAAADLLDEAGYTAGSDGTRDLTIRFLYDGGTPTHGAAAEEVQAEWDELGITTELVAEDPTGWSTDLYQTYDWDTGFIQLAPSSPVVLSLFFLGETSENGGYNFMAVENPEYNALAEEAFTAPDADSACDLWLQAEKELIDRVDTLPLADTVSPTWLNGVTLEMPGSIAPTTIRMLG